MANMESDVQSGFTDGRQTGPCPVSQNITDLWDTDGPAGKLGHGTYIEALFSVGFYLLTMAG